MIHNNYFCELEFWCSAIFLRSHFQMSAHSLLLQEGGCGVRKQLVNYFPFSLISRATVCFSRTKCHEGYSVQHSELQLGRSYDLSQQQLEDLIKTEDHSLVVVVRICLICRRRQSLYRQIPWLKAYSLTTCIYMVLWVSFLQRMIMVDLHNMCERNCQHCYMRRSNKDAKRFMCFPVGHLLLPLPSHS